MPARKPKTDEKPQSERSIETARETGASEEHEVFERVFEKFVQNRRLAISVEAACVTTKASTVGPQVDNASSDLLAYSSACAGKRPLRTSAA